MGIINATPDSFHAGSRAETAEAGLAMARRAADEGADILDIGGESTRPGAARVGAQEQLDRVLPIIGAIRGAGGALSQIPISVDTTLARVAEAAVGEGADAINDVSGATEQPRALLALAASTGAGLVLMHRARPPELDRYSDRYSRPPMEGDVVGQVADALRGRARDAEHAGVAREAILLDPGLGFGKTVGQNLDLVRGTQRLVALGYPVLSAASRKSFVGRVSRPEHDQTDPSDRLPGSLAFSVAHLAAGARIFRVHDVAPQREALFAAWAIGGWGD